ncbi:hypothetical protein AAEU29_13240 [Pseudoalteromonas sp. SSM20]|uniref:hypothetical protein n=1 Tax=Pseudoalteromonas sp. SSM20 TaxID=3139394 RepID=UPI003BAD1697
MNFSYQLIEKYKAFKGYSQDKQVIADMPNINSGNMTQIKKGDRHLTANQVIFLSEEIGMDVKEALLQLALEKSKSKEESKIWTDVIKKISAACVAISLCVGLAAEPNKGALAQS